MRDNERDEGLIFYLHVIYRAMNDNVIQTDAGRRMTSVIQFRVDPSTAKGFATIALRDRRTPSNLARKIITDFVQQSQLEGKP